jgi:hypothetical protein
MRRLPRSYPTTLLLHFGNASLEQSSIMENGVARPECSADMERDTFLITYAHTNRHDLFEFVWGINPKG